MTLLSVRQQFVNFSGRRDLVVDTTSYANNGADFFIQSGQQWLDENTTIYKSSGRYFKPITVASWYVLIPSCRAVQEVWVSDPLGGKWQLRKRDRNDLLYWIPWRNNVGDIYLPDYWPFSGLLTNPTNLLPGAPVNYCPASIRISPETDNVIVVDEFGTTVHSAAGNSYDYNAILFMPLADVAYTIEIVGLFYQPALTADASKNFWTEQRPFDLVLAACMMIEMSYRNKQGVDDYENAIRKRQLGLEFDFVEQESSGVTQFEG